MTDRQINKPITSNLIWFSPDYNLFHTQAVSDRNSFIFQWFCSNDRGWLRFIAFYGFIGGRQMDACINIIKKNVAHLSELREHQNKSENKLRGRVATTKIRNENWDKMVNWLDAQISNWYFIPAISRHQIVGLNFPFLQDFREKNRARNTWREKKRQTNNNK
jgi:hypothetical protein